MVDLTIVVVSWNVRDLLVRCLNSILQASKPPGNKTLDIEIIVVDNASTDGSIEAVLTKFPQIQLITNNENRGFTAANNQGLAVSHGRYLLLLNPDAELRDDALAIMIEYMDAHAEASALGPKLMFPDGSLQPSRRRFPTFATGLVESTILQEWWSENRILTHYYMIDTDDDQIQPVDWVVGACLLVRREVYEQIGGLDEGFFMYSEELDWCKRIKDAGGQVNYVPTATVIHHEGKSSEQVVAARHIYFQSSKVRYFRKHHGTLQGEVLRFFLLSTFAFQWAREGFKWLIGHKRPMRAERIQAYRQVLRSRLEGRVA